MCKKIRFSSDLWERDGQFSMFDHDMQAEILEHVVAISTPNGTPDSIVPKVSHFPPLI